MKKKSDSVVHLLPAHVALVGILEPVIPHVNREHDRVHKCDFAKLANMTSGQINPFSHGRSSSHYVAFVFMVTIVAIAARSGGRLLSGSGRAIRLDLNIVQLVLVAVLRVSGIEAVPVVGRCVDHFTLDFEGLALAT